jgi:diguanylate cyclase (GGDEF)-like protein
MTVVDSTCRRRSMLSTGWGPVSRGRFVGVAHESRTAGVEPNATITPASNRADRAANDRDVAALARDEAAEARDAASAGAREAEHAAGHHRLAVEDRAAAVLDRQEAAVRSIAAMSRDEAAEARGIASAATGDVLHAAADTAAEALERQAAILLAVARTLRDGAAEAREVASTGLVEAQHAVEDRAAAVLDRRAAAVRAIAALARDEAAEARDIASAATGEAQQAAGDRILAADDRAAAAEDRHQAAADRDGAADSLHDSYRDDLTGALRRGPGRTQLQHAVDRAHRGEPLVVAYLDVDNLKRANDVHGHAAGDDLLRAVGLALKEGLRSYDVVVRYGGDEFVCALPGTRLATADQRFAAVSEALSAAHPLAAVTVGLAELQADEHLDDVIGRADREMYAQRCGDSRTTERP